MIDTIYVTENGLEEFKNEINNLKEKVMITQIEKNKAYAGAVGDGWHDNFAYEDAKRQEDRIVSQIEKLVELSHSIQVIQKEKLKDNQVNIDDIVEIEFIYENGEIEKENIKLTGLWKSKEFDDYHEITLNSPLGKAIYQKKINDIIEYQINNKTITIKIINKIDNYLSGK